MQDGSAKQRFLVMIYILQWLSFLLSGSSTNFWSALIAGQTGVTEKSKHEAIVNRLDSMDFLDADYCRSFECVVERIEPVIEALDSFIDFLDAVCTERNSPPVNMPRHSYPPGSATAAVTKDLHNNPSGSSNDDRSSQLDYKPVPFPTISSQSQLQPRVSRWKLSLSHKYCVEDLSVSVAELRVFAKLLVHVRDAHSEALTTVEFCKEMHTLANNMQQIFEDWFYACRRVEERHEKDGKEVDDDDDGYHGKGREKYAEEKDRARRSMSPLLEEI